MRWIMSLLLLVLITGCDDARLNDPHKRDQAQPNVGYSSFAESPKTLDPAKSYSENEYAFIGQIYEPLLQYHLLKRPYQLEPLTAVKMPEITYLDKNKKPLPKDVPVNDIAYSVYDIKIKPGIFYQPHPGFARDESGNLVYNNLSRDDLKKIRVISDFKYTGTRELTAHDYAYQIKRLANPHLNSPIYGVMKNYIVGIPEFQKKLTQIKGFIDLRAYDLAGVKVIDDHHLQITIKGKYPQFIYWLAMPFFAPIPWEVDDFYAEPGMESRNLNFDWYPVGTGPYYLSENNPNQQMVLTRNPNYHADFYPSEGEPGDEEAGYLEDAGKPLPFIDKFVFSLEKETIPRWNKFLQGYYDKSTISSDSFDQAIQIDNNNVPSLTPEMKKKNIHLDTVVSASIFYFGFNMLDPIVGGDSKSARKLRQAISIVMDFQEYVSIFLNGRGLVANGPIPPGIFGYENVPNPVTNHDFAYAKKLLAEAGYPDGINEKTGEPLVLNFDVPSTGGPDDTARFDWMRKQFSKLGIQLHVRATQYNRFQKKMRTGDFQLFFWGWNADYPDPENFLFLFYGPNGKVKHGGENAANYQNDEFDRLFEKMKNMENTAERKKIIDKMVAIVQNDAPWIFGFFPKGFVLSHDWYRVNKSNSMANNQLKYSRLNPVMRAELQEKWNAPITWPIKVSVLGLVIIVLPVFFSYWHRQHRSRKRKS